MGGGGLVLGCYLDAFAASTLQIAKPSAIPESSNFNPNDFIRISPEGVVTLT